MYFGKQPLSETFYSAAAKMENEIQRKFNSGVSNQRPTPRRLRIIAGMEEDGRKLKQIQSALYALADLHKSGKVPKPLQGLTTKSQVADIIKLHFFTSCRERMVSAGIHNQEQYDKVRSALLSLGDGDEPAHPLDVQIKRLERDLCGCKIPGFFITPAALALRMVDLADIEPGMSILEPSAGNGSIAAAIRDQFPDNELVVIEPNHRLTEILRLKKFNIAGSDFLEHKGEHDRIIMNPPFEKLADIDHVMHAYDCLKTGGRIVAIMSPGPFFRSEKKSTSFRTWLETKLEYEEDLESGTFGKELTSTNVRSRLLVIDKIEED